LSEDGSTAEGLVKVADLVKKRLDERGWRVARVARESGLKENTIKGVIGATGKATKSTLVALAAVLEWNHQYLYDTACGKAADPRTPLEVSFARMFDRLAEVAMKSDLAGLENAVHTINGKMDSIIERLGPIDDDPSSD
jgi:hypothetical protein